MRMVRLALTLLSVALFASLVSSATVNEGRISGADRLREPEIDKCLKSKICAITYDFKPTCASDGRTYANTRTIHCLNECLKPEEQLTVVSGWYCKDDAPHAVSII